MNVFTLTLGRPVKLRIGQVICGQKKTSLELEPIMNFLYMRSRPTDVLALPSQIPIQKIF